MEATVTDCRSDGENVASGWDTQPHPWRRYGARLIDVQIFGGILLLIGGAIIGLAGPDWLLEWVSNASPWKSILIFGPLTWLCAAAVMTFLVAWKGTSPGKLLFGLRVRASDMGSVSLLRAAKREWSLLIWGIGFAIPFLNLLALGTSFSQLGETQRTRWDQRADMVVQARPLTGWQAAGTIFGTLLVIAILAWGIIGRAGNF